MVRFPTYPLAAVVSCQPICADQLFLILYRELYYRHVYSRLQPDIDDRFHSYENSCELFNYLLSAFFPLHPPSTSIPVMAFRRFGGRSCTAPASGTVAMGYRRRVYLSIPVLLRLARESKDQD